VIVDLYEDDLPWVREGDVADMTVAGIPGRTFTGKVSYIYPYLEAKTRTVKMRLEFDNPELALKPEMFANVVVNISFAVLGIALLFRYVKTIGYNVRHLKFYKKYFFLYLCTFEIIPWIFVVKFYDKFLIS